MYCIKCGTKLPEGANFCFNCGTKQTLPSSPKANTPQFSYSDLVSFEYDDIKELSSTIINGKTRFFLLLTKNGKYGLAEGDFSHIIFDCQFDRIDVYSAGDSYLFVTKRVGIITLYRQRHDNNKVLNYIKSTETSTKLRVRHSTRALNYNNLFKQNHDKYQNWICYGDGCIEGYGDVDILLSGNYEHIYVQSTKNYPRYIRFEYNGKLGFIVTGSKVIKFDAIYDDIRINDSLDIILMKQGTKWGAYSSEGSKLPVAFDEIKFERRPHHQSNELYTHWTDSGYYLDWLILTYNGTKREYPDIRRKNGESSSHGFAVDLFNEYFSI